MTATIHRLAFVFTDTAGRCNCNSTAFTFNSNPLLTLEGKIKK